jgi:hypothetical protein
MFSRIEVAPRSFDNCLKHAARLRRLRPIAEDLSFFSLQLKAFDWQLLRVSATLLTGLLAVVVGCV